jgi:hypothetical protein
MNSKERNYKGPKSKLLAEKQPHLEVVIQVYFVIFINDTHYAIGYYIT